MIANNYCPKIACYADIRFQLGKPSNNVVDFMHIFLSSNW